MPAKLQTILIHLAAFVAAFWPLELWLLFYKLVHPVGFIQTGILIGAGFWILGGLQVIMLILYVCFLVVIFE